MATARLEISAPREVGAQKSDRGLTQKAYLNALSTLLDYGAKVAVLSVVTPLLLAGLGSSLFGLWQMLSRLVTYMQAADGRPTQALKWVIANRQAAGDDDEKRGHVGSALGVWLIFLPFMTIAGALLVWLAPTVTKVPPQMYRSVRFTVALLVINFLLTNLVALPEAVLRGMNLGYKRMGLQAALSFVGGALMVGALSTGAGLVGLAAAQIILAALTGVLFWIVVKKYVPWFGIARPRFAEVRSFLKLSVWWFAWTLISKLLTGSDIVILGIIASTSEVTTYTLTSYAALTLINIIAMLVGAATPGLGGVIGAGEYEKAAALRGEMMRVSWLVVTATGATILLCNRSFTTLWVGRQHYAGVWANLLIVVAMVQLVFIRNDSFVIDLTLQLREKVMVGAVSSTLSIILSALLIPLLGIAGLCLGLIAGRLILTVAYPRIVNAQLCRPRTLALGPLARPAATMILLFAISAYLGERILTSSWLFWLALASAGFCLALCSALFIGFGADSRRPLIKRLLLIRTLRPAR